MKRPLQPELNLKLTTEQVRRLGRNALSKVGDANSFGTEQAAAFLMVHGPMLEDKLNDTIRSFVTDRLVGA